MRITESTLQESKLSTTEDTEDTEEESRCEQVWSSVSSVSSVSTVVESLILVAKPGHGRSAFRRSKFPSAAARYPTTADLSPDTSPESA